MRKGLILAALGLTGAALAQPTVNYRIGGNGANDASNDVWLDSIRYSSTEIYTGFLGPQAILNLNGPGGSSNTGHRVVGPRNSPSVADKAVVLDDGDGRFDGDEVSNAVFRQNATMAFQSRNLNYFYDVSSDGAWSMTLDFRNNPFRNKIVYFERGGGGSNSYMQLEAVDINGNRLGNAFLIRPRTSRDLGLQGSTYSLGKTASANTWSQTFSFYDLNVSDLGVSQISLLRISSPTGVTLGAGEDLQPDFKIFATQNPVPEPGTMTLLGAGALAWWAKKRKKQA